MSTSKPSSSGVLGGAAFLMAVSAIGPGFLTQTTQFTARLGASLAFAILLSTLIDIGAQLNTWRVVCVSGRRGQEVASAVVPGLGWLVTAVRAGRLLAWSPVRYKGITAPTGHQGTRSATASDPQRLPLRCSHETAPCCLRPHSRPRAPGPGGTSAEHHPHPGR